MSKGPILIDLESAPKGPGPATALPVPDLDLPQTGLQKAVFATGRARAGGGFGRWILALGLGFVGALATVAAWDLVIGLISRNSLLGYGVALLGVAFGLAVLLALVAEMAALARLSRVDRLQRLGAEAWAEEDLGKAQAATGKLVALYQRRADLDWARSRCLERAPEQLDAAALLGLVEVELLGPLDKAAAQEVQAAARQVATVTALVPLALADVFAALTANLRMIRRVAEIYGGRAGTLGSLRLMRAVMTHLVATGAVAIGDDLLGSLAGGGLLSKLSRRFGEGVVNGALTVRVGVAAMEVCRPLPFRRQPRPSVGSLVKGALGGLFGGGGK